MKRGFTLVELLVVMAILAIMTVVMIGILNPIALADKGYDARRKKDLGRIRVAFEEYYSDKGCYPKAADISGIYGLTDKSNCSKSMFPWLAPWPCDPSGETYVISVQDNDCPHWFKVYAKLRNHQDKEIPEGWYFLPDTIHLGNGEISGVDVNFGASSTNVNWYDQVLVSACAVSQCQHRDAGAGSCISDSDCSGNNCYAGDCYNPRCKVDHCGN